MPTEFEILNEQKNVVTNFDSKEKSEKYISENSDKNYIIKEKHSWAWKDYAIFGVAFVLTKFIGIGGFISILVAYYLNQYLFKRINKFLSVILSILVGFILYATIVYFITESVK